MSYGYSEVERADEALVCMRKVVRCCVWRRWGLRGKVDGWMVSRTRPVILRDATGYGKNNRGLRLKVALSSKMQLVVAWLFFFTARVVTDSKVRCGCGSSPLHGPSKLSDTLNSYPIPPPQQINGCPSSQPTLLAIHAQGHRAPETSRGGVILRLTLYTLLSTTLALMLGDLEKTGEPCDSQTTL